MAISAKELLRLVREEEASGAHVYCELSEDLRQKLEDFVMPAVMEQGFDAIKRFLSTF